MGAALLIAVLAGVGALCVFGLPPRRAQRARRLREVAARDDRPAAPRMALRWTLAIATAFAGWFGLGGIIGTVVGVGGAIGIIATARLGSPPPLAAPDVVPVVVELLAGCLDAGLTMPDSLEAASVAGDPVTAVACLAAAAALRRGAPASEAWASWLSDPLLEVVARATIRTTSTGAGVAEDLRRTAVRLRSRRQARMQQRVQQASIWIVVPLGLFFLPAFVLLAVVPVVVGLFGGFHL